MTVDQLERGHAVSSLQHLQNHNSTALQLAIAYLGENWVLHSKYHPIQHHLSGHRQSAVLAPVIAAAQKAGRL